MNRLDKFSRVAVCVWAALAFAVPSAHADFNLLMRNLTGGSDGNPGSAVETKAILALGAPNAQYAYTDFMQNPTPETINVGGGGTYQPTNPLPNGQQQTDRYCLKATANIIIPAGTWTIGFGSDDGGSIIIPGITFTSRFNNNGTAAANEVIYDRGRGHSWTGGTFTLNSALETTIEAIMWEGGGGDSWELGLAQGQQGGHNGNWALLQNGLHGWVIQTAPLEDTDPPLITDLSPSDDGIEVFRGTDLVATFNEDIALTGNGSITITDLTNGTDNYTINLPHPSVTVDGSVLTIGSPGTLAIENEYAVQISADAIQDQSVDNIANGGPNDFAGILDNTTWNFTTVVLDASPPTIINSIPTDDAIFVRLDQTLTGTFDDDIVLGTGNIYIHDIADGVNLQTISVTDSSQVTLVGKDLIITPATLLEPDRELAVRWDAGIVQNFTDVPNVAFNGNGWSFNTTSATLANSIFIFNNGFEANPLSMGNETFSAPQNWSIYTRSEFLTPTVSYVHPYDTEQTPGTEEADVPFYTLGAPEFDHFATVVPQQNGDKVGLSQIMANEHGPDYPAEYDFIDGVDYQLKVRIGRSKNYPTAGYSVQLLAGGVVLAEDLNSIELGQDDWVEATLEYVHDPANAYLAGTPLEIRLLTIGLGVGNGADIEFDDVRLTYGYTSPQADPGGPYTVTPAYDLFLDGTNSRPADLATITSYEWDLDNDGVFGDVPNVAQPLPGGITDDQLIGTYGLTLGDNTIALRITDDSGQTSTATTNVRIDFSSVVPGADLVFIADEDDGLNDRWEDQVPGNPSGLELLIDTFSVSHQPVASATQITNAYDFPGLGFGNVDGALLVGTGTTSPRSFQSAPGDWSDDKVSFEIWFKPRELQPFAFNGQILFEDGGDSGIGLFISEFELICGQDAASPNISYDLGADPDNLMIGGAAATDEFIQVVVTRDEVGGTIMYINGQQVGVQVNDDDGDWSGGDAAAFGTLGGTNVGGRESPQFDTESFDGQIAIIRVYSGEVLTAAQVLENFNAVNATDTIPPFIQAFSPQDDSTDVLVTSNFEASFDSDIQLTGSGTVTLKHLSGGSDVVITLPDGQVTLNERVVTIDPTSDLDYGADYAVRISADAVQDTAGNPFAGILDDTTWNFSTVVQDLTPPVLVATNPADNAFDVSPVGTILQASFSDNILAGTGTIVIWEVDPETGIGSSIHETIDIQSAPGQISITDNVLTVVPGTPLVGGTLYAVRMDAGVVQNTSFVDFAGISDDTTWNFLLGTPLFTDNFESPDVSAGQSDPAFTSQQVDTAKWVRSTQGFGSESCGIVDEASGQVADPTGQQAFAFRDSSSGVTTALDAIGDLIPGVVYQISFDVVEDGQTNGKDYNMALVTFSNGGTNADREDAIAMANDTTSVLHTVSGVAPAGGAYQTVSFEYVAPFGHAAGGDDLALRFLGTPSAASIDNVNVTLAITPDTLPPTLVSITDDRAGGPILTGEVVVYTVSFIEDMQALSLTAEDFSNAGTVDYTINSITETEDTSGVFQVSVTPNTVGTLQLQIPAGAEILDMGGNPLDTNTPITDDTLILVGWGGPNEIPAFIADPFSTADATEDSPYSATIAGSATDADTDPVDTLTYGKIAGPAWLNVAPDGTLSGTPTNDDVGLNVFTVSVNDAKLIFPVEATLNITVLNTNDAPFFNEDPIAGPNGIEDAAYVADLKNYVTDVDVSDTLTFAKVGGPSWLVVAPDGTLSGTPLDADLGPNAFIVSVTDGTIPTPIQAALNINVLFVNDASDVDAGPDQWVNMSEVPWTPAEIETAAWYDASNVGSITNAGGGAVSGWADLSGNGNHLVQTIENRRPTTGVRTLNGMNVLDFDENPADNLISTNGFDYDMVYVVTFNDQPGMPYSNRPTVISAISPSSYTIQFVGQQNPVSFLGGGFRVDGEDTGAAGTDADLVTQRATLIRKAESKIDQRISVGSDREIAPRSWDGYVAEVIYLESSVSVADQQKVEGYLMHKWGLEGNLPADHPYKAEEPAPESYLGVANLEGSATDEEGDSLTYTWIDTGTGTGTEAVGFSDPNILQPTFSATGVGSYVLRLTADDGNSTASDEVTINFVIDTDDPTLASVDIVDDQGGAAVIEGDFVTYTLTFSEDMDVNSLNPDDFINGGTASILLGDITKISPGVFTVVMRPISTGTLQFQVPIGATITDLVGKPLDTSSAITDDTTITVNAGPPNDAPVFASDPFATADATEDVAYAASIATSATDDDGDTLTYTKVAGPAWLTVAPNGDLSGLPTNDDVGLNAFTISVDDGKVFVPVEATLNITVINTDDPPFFTENPIDAPDALEDVAYSGSLASYVDEQDVGDTLTFVKLNGPDWLTVAPDGSLSGTPLAADVGSNVFNVSVTDGNLPTPIEAQLDIEVLFVNDAPIVDAGEDDFANVVTGGAEEGWTYSAWTGDANSGIDAANTYTVAHSFGNNRTSLTVNGVAFVENFNGSGAGWTITAGSQSNWNGNDDAVVSGSSELLAQEFKYNGNPRKINFTGLTPGQVYEANFYSVAWENSGRTQVFSATGTGLDDLTLDQDFYGNNQGIRITCVFIASGTTQEFDIDPTGGATFHLYAMTNHETQLAGAGLQLNGSATDEEGDGMTYTWIDTGTGTGTGVVSFSDANILNPEVTLTELGTYVLRLTANDGNSNGFDEVTITVLDDNTNPTLASTDFVDDQGGAAVEVNSTVIYTVTFSEDIEASTVTPGDFENGGTSGISIGTITEPSPGVFTVPVTPTTVGTLQLQVRSGATITDVVDNPLDASSAIADDTIITVNADTTNPTLVSTDFVDDQGGADVDPDTLVTYTVTFSEDMDASSVTAADFSNAGSSSITLGTITETSPGVFTVEVTPTTSGSLQLQVSAAAVLNDVAGNPLNTTSAIADDTTITVTGSNPYDGWAATYPGLSDPSPSVDFDNGGLAASLEWVLGGDPTDAGDDNSILPTSDASSPTHTTFTFRRSAAAEADGNTSIAVEYGSDMNFASTAQDGVSGISFTTTADFYAPGIDRVVVSIPKSLAPSGKMFMRLKVNVTSE